MELFRQTNIDFLKYKWWAIGASWALIGLGLFAIFVQKGLKFGIDFSGGTAIAVRFAERPDVDQLRKHPRRRGPGRDRHPALRGGGEERGPDPRPAAEEGRPGRGRRGAPDVCAGAGFADGPGQDRPEHEGKGTLAARLVAADPDQVAGRSDVNPADHYAQVAERVIARRSSLGLFRSPADVNAVEGVSPAVKEWIQANAYTGPFVLLSAENVGPQVGADLQKKALLAVFWSSIGMLAYIAVRFRSLPFGIGAIVATVHDTLITVGLLAIFGREFNLVVVAALLTLVGYSVNDTVVVYDRVRENLHTPKKEALEAVINRSINQTLSRTILTSGATMLVVVALFFLGGEVLNTFALTLIIGIIIGTYSSIYVAAAIVVIWKDFRSRRKLAAVPAPAPPAAAAPGRAAEEELEAPVAFG